MKVHVRIEREDLWRFLDFFLHLGSNTQLAGTGPREDADRSITRGVFATLKAAYDESHEAGGTLQPERPIPYVTEEELADVAPQEEIRQRIQRASNELSRVKRVLKSPEMVPWPSFKPHPQDAKRCYICGNHEGHHGTTQNHCPPFEIPQPSLVTAALPCTICGNRLGMDQTLIGDGDGNGQKFAHAGCYRRREGIRAACKAAEGVAPNRGDGVCAICGLAVEDH